jgi:hypothetical protein
MRRSQLAIFTFAAVALIGTASAQEYTKADYNNGVPPPITEDGGDTCAEATPIGAVPFTDTGTTVGNTNTVAAVPLSCNGNYTTVNGEDGIYVFTTAGGIGNLTLELEPDSADYDPSIYVLTTCDDGNTCAPGFGADNCFAENAPGNPCGVVGTETIGPLAFPDNTYFFYVDSFYTEGGLRSAGPFTLTVSGVLPAELLDFQVD